MGVVYSQIIQIKRTSKPLNQCHSYRLCSFFGKASFLNQVTADSTRHNLKRLAQYTRFTLQKASAKEMVRSTPIGELAGVGVPNPPAMQHSQPFASLHSWGKNHAACN